MCVCVYFHVCIPLTNMNIYIQYNSSQSYGFSSSHVWMWESDYKESWASKNWCFWTVVLEKTLESALDCKEIQPVHRRTDWFEKTLMLGKIEGMRRSGWQRMRWLDGIINLMDMSFELTLEVGDGQGGLASCCLWGRKKSDMTEQLNWTVELSD